MGRFFGTDGIRGIANKDLTPLLAYSAGRAGAYHFQQLVSQKKQVQLVLGKDPRLSSDMLEGALISGICSVGANVLLAGVVPTPCVSFLTSEMGADGGIMVSASHNPIEDNGIKFFGKDGSKLSQQEESNIETTIEAIIDGDNFSIHSPIGKDVGRVIPLHDAVSRYVRFLIDTVQVKFSSTRIVLDCAFGAVCETAPRVFKSLGAQVVLMNGEWDGSRINVNCGAIDTTMLKRAVIDNNADIGFAFDGDGDRVIAIDHKGAEVNGDRMMFLLAVALKKKRRLKNDLLVTTVMSSCGLEEALKRYSVSVIRTSVGDRYVYEEMIKSGVVIGGEQSGHILLLNYAPTGDGVLTALQIAAIVVEEECPLSELASEMKDLPQILLNVPVANKDNLNKDNKIEDVIKECESRLMGRGRILVRPSGTEPLVRVMAEGPDEKELKEVVETIAKTIEVRLR